jgi:hypothetical protein
MVVGDRFAALATSLRFAGRGKRDLLQGYGSNKIPV